MYLYLNLTLCLLILTMILLCYTLSSGQNSHGDSPLGVEAGALEIYILMLDLSIQGICDGSLN